MCIFDLNNVVLLLCLILPLVYNFKQNRHLGPYEKFLSFHKLTCNNLHITRFWRCPLSRCPTSVAEFFSHEVSQELGNEWKMTYICWVT